MQSYRLRITPQSAFATELLGDTLFGQLCWAIRHRLGETHLQTLLQGYTENKPFAVVSNAFPQGMIPRPSLPVHYFAEANGKEKKSSELKILKKRIWLPLEAVETPLAQWQQHSKSNKEVGDIKQRLQAHNTLNRLTETTGTGAFAPYTMTQYWYQQGTTLDIYVLFDDTQCSAAELQSCFDDIGCFGYGGDASIGMGKYRIDAFSPYPLPSQAHANACLSLASCAPQGCGFDPQRSFYQLSSHFGRHGDIAANMRAKPFKNPVLMTQAGAVFSTPVPKNGFIGQGLGGNGQLSKSIHETVHQGYAPVIGIHLPPLAEHK
ncbi:MAG TPA: CRISPR-associated protein Csm7 [Thiothrix sp.]|nr:CRISPR-associated protein Csm7 [Thiothrix sp.]